MIRKILFGAAVIASGFASAQTFQLTDVNNNDISGTTHYEYGTLAELAVAKFHIKNLTSSVQEFALKVTLVETPYTNSNLGVCFGTACFSAFASTSGTQIINNGDGDNIPASGIYTDMKIGPVTWMWADCATSAVVDSAVWIVTVYDSANPSDSSSASIVWKCGDAPTSVEEIDKNAVKLSAFPNPASADLTINYSIKASYNTAEVKVYDVLGQEVVSRVLDANQGQVDLNVSNLNSGVYFYAIKVDEQTIRTERIIVQ